MKKRNSKAVKSADPMDEVFCTPHGTAHSRRMLPHQIPFLWIFEELWQRRSADLEAQVRRVYGAAAGEERATLDAKIQASNEVYKLLLSSKECREGEAYGDAYEQLCMDADRSLLDVLHGMESSALCLSGGGIRSASFCLGVLQGLSRFGFSGGGGPKQPHAMSELDYLSTVSGGGYIGSWLMAWTKRLADPPPGKKGASHPRRPSDEAFLDVVKALAGHSPHTSGDPAPRAVRHLRDYTSFLAPKFGLTLDTWTLGAIVFRNLLVNWVMILPIFLAVISMVQAIHSGLFRVAAMLVHVTGFYLPFGVATFLFIFAGVMAGFRMPSRQADELFGAKLEPKMVGVLFILPLAISTVLLMAIWLEMRGLWTQDPRMLIFWFALSGAVSFAVVPIVRTRFSRPSLAAYSDHRPRARYFAGVIGSMAAGTLLSLALFAAGSRAEGWLKHAPKTQVPVVASTTLLSLSDHSTVDLRVTQQASAAPGLESSDARVRTEVNGRLNEAEADRFILFGFPIVWLILMLASSLFSGFIGEYETDIDREWWARSGGIMMYVLVLWIFSQAIVIYAPHIFSQSITLGRLSGAGLFTGLLGAFGGFSTAGAPGNTGKKTAEVSPIGSLLNRFGLVVPVICSIALLALILLLTNFEANLAERFGGAHSPRAHLWIFFGSQAIALLVNWAVNINIFSLHGMYRMRLMRAFLGSSNPHRRPDAFTGFDERDLIWETDVPCGPRVPLHLINATVNLVGTQDAAWAQRKAEGFTFSPLFCGGWRLGFVPTGCYGGNRGVSLATAMAISGAAFNPNMGYHSSPLVTLIMTLFNVRLGWWLPNPKYERGPVYRKLAKWFGVSMKDLMAKKSPRLALRPLINEMLGGTDDTTPYIELTDGGHFENLGLYEMVLRRCKKIIVVDAGADPRCEFEDLGNALRKIEIDLGIPIEFRDHKINMREGADESNLRCAIADIHYDCVDGVSGCSPGTLIYIKAGINGQEPPDVLQYARTHPTFPHEATANQFFNESQFESYRHLGSFAVDQIVSRRTLGCNFGTQAVPGEGGLNQFFEVAEAYVRLNSTKADVTDNNSMLAASILEEALKRLGSVGPPAPPEPVVK